MANTITEVANVYTQKRDVARTAEKTGLQPEKVDSKVTGLPVIDSETLNKKIENLSQIIQRNIEFSVDDDTGQSIVRVVDSDTGEVVRQIPSDQILHLISQVEEWRESMKSGVLLDVSV